MTIGAVKELLKRQRPIAALDQTEGNQLYFNFKKSKNENFSLMNEITQRKIELEERFICVKKIKKHILHEYKGIKWIKIRCRSNFLKSIDSILI